MASRQPRYSKEEFARRGNQIYESQIRKLVENENYGKIALKDTASHIAIDIETSAFELGNTTIKAVNNLYQKYPDAQPWVIRIGHDSVYRFGSRSISRKS